MTSPITGVDNARIAVIGLGYVGLPLAVAFGKGREVVGFDINTARNTTRRNRHRIVMHLATRDHSRGAL